MLTTKQLAEKSGKTTRWIQMMCEQGTIKAKKYGHAYLIEQPDADEWLASLDDKEKPDKE